MAKQSWSKGRGKLGLFKPLLGSFVAKVETEMGLLTCTRSFDLILSNKYVQLSAVWVFDGSDKPPYSEHCLFGVGKAGLINFWSFTNDGKQSQGVLASAPDIHDQAICFEADMDAGHARQVYWPLESGEGFNWCVESESKKGWNRFVAHAYSPK